MIEINRQELFAEITAHLLRDDRPSEYIAGLSEQQRYKEYPFAMLWKMKTTEQSAKYHPEGSVWNHTLLVLDEAAIVRSKVKDPDVFMWAALLHDIGKPGTTRVKNCKITSYDHDKEGEKLCVEFLSCFTEDQTFISEVAALVRYHMHMLYVQKNLPFQDVKALLQRVEVEDIALLCRCDRLGRLGADLAAEETNYIQFIGNLRAATHDK
jgi:putative nucleotidyltransferase with HDIG domain